MHPGGRQCLPWSNSQDSLYHLNILRRQIVPISWYRFLLPLWLTRLSRGIDSMICLLKSRVREALLFWVFSAPPFDRRLSVKVNSICFSKRWDECFLSIHWLLPFHLFLAACRRMHPRTMTMIAWLGEESLFSIIKVAWLNGWRKEWVFSSMPIFDIETKMGWIFGQPVHNLWTFG